jgi:hypothetical protein
MNVTLLRSAENASESGEQYPSSGFTRIVSAPNEQVVTEKFFAHRLFS